MTDSIEKLARAIYDAVVEVSLERNLDQPFYRRIPTTDAVSIIPFEQLPEFERKQYLETASRIIEELL